jgi:ATP-dependent 26S proteasome regulatory subunit
VDVEKVIVTMPKDGPGESEEDLYSRLKELQRELEFVEIQEEYVKDEQKNLKIELLRAQEEVKRIQAVPLVIGQFLEMVDENAGIVSSTTGVQLLRPHPIHAEPRAAQALVIRRAPPPLQRAGRYPAPRG